jgi:hypothetical protein
MRFNLHELGRRFGQRAHGRLFIPGASVAWKLAGQKSFPESRFPLSDLSAGGLAFLANNPPDIGAEIAILVSIPQKTDAFEVKGEVKYSILRGLRLTYKYRVGVEFHPFNKAEGCNDLQVLDELNALEKAFGKKRSKTIKGLKSR